METVACGELRGEFLIVRNVRLVVIPHRARAFRIRGYEDRALLLHHPVVQLEFAAVLPINVKVALIPGRTHHVGFDRTLMEGRYGLSTVRLQLKRDIKTVYIAWPAFQFTIASKLSKIVIERAVLLDKEDHVLDVLQSGSAIHDRDRDARGLGLPNRGRRRRQVSCGGRRYHICRTRKSHRAWCWTDHDARRVLRTPLQRRLLPILDCGLACSECDGEFAIRRNCYCRSRGNHA